ncbi:hypothetical protein BLOT_009971 [Blomia tropicalis]|nr:hypothetical protein BLOT_009971 [Blomia tropicalis]
MRTCTKQEYKNICKKNTHNYLTVFSYTSLSQTQHTKILCSPKNLNEKQEQATTTTKKRCIHFVFDEERYKVFKN